MASNQDNVGSNPTGGSKKKRGMAHYLHKQWVQTKMGAELHAADMRRQAALPKKAKVVK